MPEVKARLKVWFSIPPEAPLEDIESGRAVVSISNRPDECVKSWPRFVAIIEFPWKGIVAIQSDVVAVEEQEDA